jgi:hypothetical protein
MQKVESAVSQAMGMGKESSSHVADQAGLHRNALFDMTGRVALVTGMPL